MRTILAMGAMGIVVAAVLLAVVGIFWVIDLAPLVIFLGVAVAYGILSSNTSTAHRGERNGALSSSEYQSKREA